MIEGRYFPPNASRALPARMWGVAGDLRLRLDGEDEVSRPRLAAVSDRLASVPRKLTFADGGVFEAPPGADVDSFLDSHGSFFSRLSRLETSWTFIVAATVVTIGLLAAAYRYGIPLMAAAAAAVTPAAIVDVMDRGTLQAVERTFFADSTLEAAEQERLAGLFDELAELSEVQGLRLLVRDGGGIIGANALALPGGTIVVTDQLVRKARSDDEIAGVIGHEIGHVGGRHSLKQIYRVLGLGFMIGVIGGDSGQLVDDVVTQAAALQSIAYTREFEADADAYAVALMVRAGRDPTAFVDLLERLGEGRPGAKKTDWLSTHPGSDDRREAVEALARRLGWRR